MHNSFIAVLLLIVCGQAVAQTPPTATEANAIPCDPAECKMPSIGEVMNQKKPLYRSKEAELLVKSGCYGDANSPRPLVGLA